MDTIKNRFNAFDKKLELAWLDFESAFQKRLSAYNFNPDTFPSWYREVFRSLEVPRYIKAYIVFLIFLYILANVLWSMYYIGCAGLWEDDSFGIWNIIILCVNSSIIVAYAVPYVLVHYIHRIKIWDSYHWTNVVEIWTLHVSVIVYHSILSVLIIWNVVAHGIIQQIHDGSDKDRLVYSVFAFAMSITCLYTAKVVWVNQRGFSRMREMEVITSDHTSIRIQRELQQQQQNSAS